MWVSNCACCTWKHCCFCLSIDVLKSSLCDQYFTNWYLSPHAIPYTPLAHICLEHISILILIKCEWSLLEIILKNMSFTALLKYYSTVLIDVVHAAHVLILQGSMINSYLHSHLLYMK